MATVRHLGLFPFCVGTYPPRAFVNGQPIFKQTGDLTGYPFQLPVRLCTRMWWTVKHWRMSFDFYQYRDVSNGNNPGDYTLIDQSFTFDTSEETRNAVPGYPPEPSSADYVRRIEEGIYGLDKSERTLTRVGATNDWEEAARLSVWEFTFSREFLVSGNSGTSEIGSSCYLYTNTDNQQFGYGPPFAFSENEEDRSKFWVAMSCGIADWESAESHSGGINGSGVFSLLNTERTFSISRPAYGVLGGVSSTTEYVSNLRIEPSEFWEYDPGDGLGPIYDKTTGAQLRAFPDPSASASASVS